MHFVLLSVRVHFWDVCMFVCVQLLVYIHGWPAASQLNKCPSAPGEKVTALESTSTGGKLQHFNLEWIDKRGLGGVKNDRGVNLIVAYNTDKGR